MTDTCRALDPYVDPPTPTVQRSRINAELREQSIRPAFLQELYRRSGRTCGTTSKLWAEFKQQCLEQFAQGLAERAREHWAQGQEGLVIGGGDGNG